MNQSIIFETDVKPTDHVNSDAIRPDSLLYSALVQVPAYNAPVAIPADILETALIVVNEFEGVRAETLRLISE